METHLNMEQIQINLNDTDKFKILITFHGVEFESVVTVCEFRNIVDNEGFLMRLSHTEKVEHRNTNKK